MRTHFIIPMLFRKTTIFYACWYNVHQTRWIEAILCTKQSYSIYSLHWSRFFPFFETKKKSWYTYYKMFNSDKTITARVIIKPFTLNREKLIFRNRLCRQPHSLWRSETRRQLLLTCARQFPLWTCLLIYCDVQFCMLVYFRHRFR